MSKQAFIVSLIVGLVLFGGLFIYQSTQFSDTLLHVVFCNVGQGDGIFIRTPEGKNIVIDGGPDDSILACLSSHMPFWDRKIHLMILSHPHDDHFLGLISVLKRYNVLNFASEKLVNKTSSYHAFLEGLKREEGIQVLSLLQGDRIKLEEQLAISILGPSQEYLSQTSPNGTIGEKSEFASVISKLTYGDFDVLFTGDSQKEGLTDALRSGKDIDLEVLQVPHHGSKTGLTSSIIGELNPELAVISVGKNRYGHPASSILQILRDKDIKILRTDQKGDVEFVSDGKKWWVK